MSTTTLMTFADFERLPELPGKQELIDGELILMPPPERLHSEIAKRILFLLGAQLHQSRVFGDHTGYRMGPGWIEPDASVIWPDQPYDEKYFMRAPMIGVEVLSSGEDIERKLTLYFYEGAREVWVIDPHERTMVVYTRPGSTIIRLEVHKEYRSDTEPLTILLSELFG